MAEASQEMSHLVAATVNRLRLIQADFADDVDKVRQEHMSDEIQRVLSTLVPAQRQAFLEQLRECFPTWDGQAGSEQQKQTRVDYSLTDQREWNDVSYVLERLIELAGSLPVDQKQKVIDQLASAGLAPVGLHGWPEQLVGELRTKLKVDAGQSIAPDRVLELTMRLVEFTYSLDQLGWQIWKNIAPRTMSRNKGNLQQTLGRFVGGEADVPLTNDLERLRHLIASILAAIAQIGDQFARQHLAKFAPHEIETSAMMEPGGFLVAKEVKCWRKYVELAKLLDESSINREVQQIIVEFVGSMPGMSS